MASLGKGGTLTQKRQKVIEHFGKLGVTPEQIFKLLDIDGLPDIKEDQLITLRGMVNAIKEGEMTIEAMFHSRDEANADTPDLNARLKKKETADERALREDKEAAL